MPMGIVSDDDLLSEIKRNGARDIPPRPVVKEPDNPGRKDGDMNVPESLRKIIAQDAIENGRASAIDLAGSFGISASSVSAYTHGATSTASYREPNGELRKSNNIVKEKIAGKARRRLGWALNGITQEKLEEADLRDISAVAKDMAVIIKQMEPSNENEGNKGTNVQVVLFSPQLMQESDFPLLRVKE